MIFTLIKSMYFEENKDTIQFSEEKKCLLNAYSFYFIAV